MPGRLLQDAPALAALFPSSRTTIGRSTCSPRDSSMAIAETIPSATAPLRLERRILAETRSTMRAVVHVKALTRQEVSQ